MKEWYLYIMASINKTLYIWVTSNLLRRVKEHKEWKTEWFTKKYHITKLVYFEHWTITWAIYREKQMKKWKREWKINLIEKENKEWQDLYWELINS